MKRTTKRMLALLLCIAVLPVDGLAAWAKDKGSEPPAYMRELVRSVHLRQYRTNCGARLARIYFRHAAQKALALRQQGCDFFVQPDEKSYLAIRTPQLCGIAFKEMRK